MNVIAALQATPLANNLSEAQLETLAKSALEKQYRAGQLIIGEGHRINAVYIVVQGTVKMSKSAHDGKEQLPSAGSG